MLKRVALLSFCFFELGTSSALAQLRSASPSVTLLADVQESFTANVISMPLQPSFAEGTTPPQIAVAGVMWSLTPGREFHVAYEVEPPSGDTFRSGPIRLGQPNFTPRGFVSPSLSPGEARTLLTWGDAVGTPAGAGGFLIGLPAPQGGGPTTLRISVVML